MSPPGIFVHVISEWNGTSTVRPAGADAAWESDLMPESGAAGLASARGTVGGLSAPDQAQTGCED